MLVEDERIVAMDLQATLVELDYEVAAAVTTGEAAIENARALRPNVILMDIRLAGVLDGVEAATQIHAESNIPIIFLTSHSDQETLRRAKGSDPYGYLLKPFKGSDLRCAIEIALHKSEIDLRLRAREQWLATTLRSISEGVVATDVHEHVTLLNPVAEALTGWNQQDALGRRIEEILRIIEQQPREHSLSQSMLVAKDGSQHPAASSSAPIVDDAGMVLGGVTILHDLTEQRAAESKIRELNDELERRVIERTRELELANKELEAFSFSVAHDLRAPLRGIDGFSQMLIEDHAANLGPEGLDHLQRVVHATKRMNELIDDLLSLSRIGRSELRLGEVDISKLAHQTIEQLRVQHPRADVTVSVMDGIRVRGDSRLLHIVLENLLGNAWKFSAMRATATIEVGRSDVEGTGGFFVRDNGAGFARATAHKLFGAFQRFHSHEAFTGTGIGLAIVHRIVMRHGGTIRAESAVDAGATFFIGLP